MLIQLNVLCSIEKFASFLISIVVVTVVIVSVEGEAIEAEARSR